MTITLEPETQRDVAQKSALEPLIFERSKRGRRGYQLPTLDVPEQPLDSLLPSTLLRDEIADEVEVSEVDVIRHFTRLSKLNVSIDAGLYPLGSCTMKHNPRLNEKMARLPGFADIHPLQPASTVQGALELVDTLAHWLKTLTGMPAVALSPGLCHAPIRVREPGCAARCGRRGPHGSPSCRRARRARLPPGSSRRPACRSAPSATRRVCR